VPLLAGQIAEAVGELDGTVPEEVEEKDVGTTVDELDETLPEKVEEEDVGTTADELEDEVDSKRAPQTPLFSFAIPRPFLR
jgi:molybdopterin converting factor small subunit